MLFLAGDFLLRPLGFYLIVIAMTASTLLVLQGYRDTEAGLDALALSATEIDR